VNDLLPFGAGAWTFLAGYLGSLLLLGWLGRRARREDSLQDFYLAGRGFGFIVLFLTLYATQYSGNTVFGVAGASAGTGVKGITTATGRGIHGVAGASATGVYAENTSTGNALYIAGRLGSATGAGNCVGTGTISSGSNNTTIANAAVTDNSLIFITPLTYGTSATYEALVPYNINSPAADQFGVRIANTSRAAPTNIDFIYLIIN